MSVNEPIAGMVHLQLATQCVTFLSASRSVHKYGGGAPLLEPSDSEGRTVESMWVTSQLQSRIAVGCPILRIAPQSPCLVTGTFKRYLQIAAGEFHEERRTCVSRQSPCVIP